MKKIILLVFTVISLSSCVLHKRSLIYTNNSENIPYSKSVKNGSGLIFTSGQLGINPSTRLLASNLESQTIQIMENIKAILEQNNSDFSHMIKVNIYLTDITQLHFVNAIYLKYLPMNKPARTTIQVVALPQNAMIEIDCIADSK
ncbi:RidA family protein [Pedobacter gandavensis]|uniref:RidA family protein n=1 Tax=Pedobacter TaxID=84567 RepID=UPI001C994B0B|nr:MULTISPECIES: RidA family protein [Pedobacter]WGQ09443.1 RidA family protein [Pedobacter gandavensis]